MKNKKKNMSISDISGSITPELAKNIESQMSELLQNGTINDDDSITVENNGAYIKIEDNQQNG